jgi:P22 coat protein - gene protein 5
MANSFITPTWVLKDVARVAVNNLKFAQKIERWYDDKYKAGGAKVGYTVSGRLPQRFRTTKGQAFQAQPINDQVVPVTLTDQANIATAWSTADATMVVEDVRRRYIDPAGEQLANTIDWDGLNRLTPTVWKTEGTPGVTPTSIETYLNAGARLTNVAVPHPGRIGILDPTATVKLIMDTKGLFNPSARVSENYRTGQFGRDQLGVGEWYEDQNRYVHTTGSFASSTPIVSGANQTGNSLLTTGWASATLNKGDIITLTGVYEVNPQNYTTTGKLQEFVVTQTTSDSGGTMTIPIEPAIVPSGNLQNVTNSPANSAPIVVEGSTLSASVTTGTMAATQSPNSLIFHPEAFVFASADLDGDLPGAEATRVSDNELSLSLRYVRQYTATTDQKMARIDALYGFAPFRPDWAVRIWG